LPESEDNWHRSKSRAGRIFFPYGLIKGVENKDGLTAYYYAAIQPTDAAGIMPMENRGTFEAFRLFATDIILLGNLNENNLYGLPQFFKSLPSTTANIPPIATVNEAADNSNGGAESENELASEQQKFLQSLQDSLNNFLEIYNKEKKYDMIINKSAILYAGKKFDITNDVINGLNKRYKKSAEKKDEKKTEIKK
jgi:hypothetical protein